MTIVVKSALSDLVTSVAAFFVTNGVTAEVSYGFRERTKQTNQGPGGANRVVFTPCDDDGNGGDVSLTAKYPGEFPIVDSTQSPPVTVGYVRELRSWPRLCVVSIWAHDDTTASNEQLQIEAVEELQRWLVRAVNASAAQDAKWGKTKWTNTPTELRNGVELRMWLTLRDSIVDVPSDIAFPGQALVTDPPITP